MADIKTLPINGERLRAFRLQARMSQGDLAKISEVSRSYIAELERTAATGKRPSRRVAVALADALDVRLDQLMS